MKISNLFEIGSVVETKSNGKCKVIGINIFVTEDKTCMKYLLEGFKNILFHEEDLKQI